MQKPEPMTENQIGLIFCAGVLILLGVCAAAIWAIYHIVP